MIHQAFYPHYAKRHSDVHLSSSRRSQLCQRRNREASCLRHRQHAFAPTGRHSRPWLVFMSRPSPCSQPFDRQSIADKWRRCKMRCDIRPHENHKSGRQARGRTHSTLPQRCWSRTQYPAEDCYAPLPARQRPPNRTCTSQPLPESFSHADCTKQSGGGESKMELGIRGP